jgi:hypothetical protein
VRHAIKTDDHVVEDSRVKHVEHELSSRWWGRLDNDDYEALIAVIDSKGSNLGKNKALRLLRDGVLLLDNNASNDQQVRLANWAVPWVEVYRKRREKRRLHSNY